MINKKNKPRRKKITIFFLTSLLFHLLLFIILRESLTRFSERQSPKNPVWVELKHMELPQKIADIDKPEKEEIPDKPSAQALYNQKVAREQVNPTLPSPVKKGTTLNAPPKETKKEETAAKKEVLKMDDLYGRKPREKQPTKENMDIATRIPGIPEMSTNPSNPFNDDYFPDYQHGGRTYLNTLKNPNIAYYAELKRRFRTTFNPIPALRGHINEIARGKIDVVLGVSVNGRGELIDIVVIRSSGLTDYDREGLRTVRSSAPFSSPPQNILGGDSLLNMAWTFVVYL